jgi:predicted RNase H-like nuclease (RuvC/YqgF family)
MDEYEQKIKDLEEELLEANKEIKALKEKAERFEKENKMLQERLDRITQTCFIPVKDNYGKR